MCFHEMFFVNLFFLDINGNFLSLLPDVMRSVHDGPQWKYVE